MIPPPPNAQSLVIDYESQSIQGIYCALGAAILGQIGNSSGIGDDGSLLCKTAVCTW
jgi:hypothetical protein